MRNSTKTCGKRWRKPRSNNSRLPKLRFEVECQFEQIYCVFCLCKRGFIHGGFQRNERAYFPVDFEIFYRLPNRLEQNGSTSLS